MRENEEEKLFEELMPEKSLNLMKYVYLQIQKKKKIANPNQAKYRENHTMAYHSQHLFKVAREKSVITWRRLIIWKSLTSHQNPWSPEAVERCL